MASCHKILYYHVESNQEILFLIFYALNWKYYQLRWLYNSFSLTKQNNLMRLFFCDFSYPNCDFISCDLFSVYQIIKWREDTYNLIQ